MSETYEHVFRSNKTGKELTVLYLKYILIKGHAVGPLMPSLLNKVNGAYP